MPAYRVSGTFVVRSIEYCECRYCAGHEHKRKERRTIDVIAVDDDAAIMYAEVRLANEAKENIREDDEIKSAEWNWSDYTGPDVEVEQLGEDVLMRMINQPELPLERQ